MKRIHPFTVFELLAVFAIMALILSISIPAFIHMSDGQRVTRAASHVAAKLTLARAQAVSGHIHTALIFPKVKNSKLEGGSHSISTALYNTSCRLAQVWKNSSGDYEFVRWLPDEIWELFGEGAAIPEPGSGSDANFGVLNKTKAEAAEPEYETDADLLPVKNVDFTDLDASTSDVARAVIFNPSGRIVMPSGRETGKVAIRFAEAVLQPDEYTFTLKKDTDGQVTYAVLIVNPLSGRAEVRYTSE